MLDHVEIDNTHAQVADDDVNDVLRDPFSNGMIIHCNTPLPPYSHNILADDDVTDLTTNSPTMEYDVDAVDIEPDASLVGNILVAISARKSQPPQPTTEANVVYSNSRLPTPYTNQYPYMYTPNTHGFPYSDTLARTPAPILVPSPYEAPMVSRKRNRDAQIYYSDEDNSD